MTLLEKLEWAEDPVQTCANSPVIMAYKFDQLATSLSERDDVLRTESEILDYMQLQSKRFSACGANNSEKFGVLRKNPKSGWSSFIQFLTEIK